MGTNYYWRDRPCEHCGRYDKIHVGKSGRTWQAFHHRLIDGAHPEWGYLVESPFGFPILSVADWRTVFTTRPGELYDECGCRVEDPVKWLDGMTPPDAEARARKMHWFRPGEDWWDPAGYHMLAADFS